MSIIDTPEWDEILRPTAMYIQTSDEAFREIVEKALGESVHHHPENENIDLTRQFSPAEIEELQKRIEAANLELGATQAFEGLNEKVQSALEEAEHARHENEEVVAVEETVQPEDDANRESVNILYFCKNRSINDRSSEQMMVEDLHSLLMDDPFTVFVLNP